MRILERIRTGDYNLERIQQNIVNFTSQFAKAEILNGILIRDAEINTTLTLEHKLGRVPLGYYVTSRDANATIWNDLPFTKESIKLNSSGNVKIDLWVF